MIAKAEKVEPEHCITARRPRFDFSNTRLHWAGGRAQTSHEMNFLHVAIPGVERAFCKLFKHVVETEHRLSDERLVDISGFVSQEALHARAHSQAFRWMQDEFGLGASKSKKRSETAAWFLLNIRSENKRLDHGLVCFELASAAALEQFTSVVGRWMYSEDAHLDELNPDPEMMLLLNWHGAEEVEHETVAYDVHQEVQRYFRRLTRAGVMGVVFPVAFVVWVTTSRELMNKDTLSSARFSFKRFLQDGRAGYIPSIGMVTHSAVSYCLPGFSPNGARGWDEERAREWLAAFDQSNSLFDQGTE